MFAVTFPQRIQGLEPFGVTLRSYLLQFLLSTVSGWPKQRHSQPHSVKEAQDKNLYLEEKPHEGQIACLNS